MEAEKNENLKESGSSGNQKSWKKSKIILTVLKYIIKGFLAVLLILSTIFQLPWKIIALLAVILAVTTILPIHFRKWFWLAAGSAALILFVWILLPENNTGWRPFSFDKEIAAFDAKYEIPDEENAAFTYYQIFNNLELDPNLQIFFSDPNVSPLDKPWSSKNYPEMAECLNRYEEPIQKFILASKIEKCILPQVSHSDSFDSSNIFYKIRCCTFLLISSANNDIGDERFNDAIEKYASIFRFANQLCQFPSMTFESAIKDKALLPLIHYIMEGHPDSEHLSRVKDLLDNPEPNWILQWPIMLEPIKLSFKDKTAGATFEINSLGKIRFSRRPFFQNDQPEQNVNIYISGIKGKIRAILRWIFLPPSIKEIHQVVDKAFEEPYAMADPDYNWNKTESPNTYIKFNYKYFIRVLSQLLPPGRR